MNPRDITGIGEEEEEEELDYLLHELKDGKVNLRGQLLASHALRVKVITVVATQEEAGVVETQLLEERLLHLQEGHTVDVHQVLLGQHTIDWHSWK